MESACKDRPPGYKKFHNSSQPNNDTNNEPNRASQATSQGVNHDNNTKSTTSWCVWVLRTLIVCLLGSMLVSVSVWLVVMLSVRLNTLQERVTELEQKCDVTEQRIESYVLANLDRLLDKVSCHKNMKEWDG